MVTQKTGVKKRSEGMLTSKERLLRSLVNDDVLLYNLGKMSQNTGSVCCFQTSIYLQY